MENFYLRELLVSDHLAVRQVYQDSIESQGHIFYSQDQIQAWSALAWLPGVLDRSLDEGKGWVSCQKNEIEAFAVRYPMHRLALLYCRGRSARCGHATALLKLVERQARSDNQMLLVTEASSFSYPLLLRSGWVMQSSEIIKIAGVKFERYLMEKKLC